MKQVQAAAIYARISSDQAGDGLGVQRQLEDCRNLAIDRGWVIADEYVDNDVSAYAAKPRPNYERMMVDIADHRIDAVLVYHLDRLTRRPVELEQFIDVCTAASVDVTTVTGDIGLGNDNGLMVARITSAMAAAESGRKSARLRRKMLQNAEMGKPNGGGGRPFGYEADKLTIRESEAIVIRDLVSRYIAGESMNSLGRWINKQPIATVGRSKTWNVQTLRGILLGGRIAGIRYHRGEPIGPAMWPPIITPEQHDRVLAVLAGKNAPSMASPRRYLLSGMLRCGKCGSKLYSSSNRGIRRYICTPVPGKDGCGQLSINSLQIEQWIAGVVLARLESPGMEAFLASRASGEERYSAEVADLAKAQEVLTQLAEMLGAGELSRADYSAARKVADQRRLDAVLRLDQATGTNALTEFESSRVALARSWDQLNLERQHAIVRSVLRYAVIQPRPRGIRAIDPSRVDLVWVT
ncbi:recombinase family protein [Leifsonia sp. SIMBA_070]|uniref:recombinase family protein n=1 Tax=Leifsonia sp. SIMBA_070 TaxID=3085810 RepID=UPI00397E0BE8